MKKGILFLMLLMLASVSFAQEVSYEQVREKIIEASEKVKIFPKDFYVKVTEPDYTNIYQQRADIIEVAYTVYRTNPNNDIAAFNYANAVLQLGRLNGDADTEINNSQEATKIMQKLAKPKEEKMGSNEQWLKAFEERQRVAPEKLTAQDYHQAGEICEKLHRNAEADMYYEMERNAGCENRD